MFRGMTLNAAYLNKKYLNIKLKVQLYIHENRRGTD